MWITNPSREISDGLLVSHQCSSGAMLGRIWHSMGMGSVKYHLLISSPVQWKDHHLGCRIDVMIPVNTRFTHAKLNADGEVSESASHETTPADL